MKTLIRSTAVRSFLAAAAEPASQSPRDLLDPLVRRAAHGDRSAIGALGRSFRPQLFAAARAHLPAFDADDVVQDLFVRLLERKLFPPPAARESAVAWLLEAVGALARQRKRG
jgi:DNA-directed RNA polymerase specialized sigma24 family protein